MKTTFQQKLGTLLMFVLLGLSGCVNLKPVESTARFYVLGAREHTDLSTPAAATNTADNKLSIGIRRIRLAAYLDTPYIVVRRGPNEVSFSENHRWGEDLQKAISRTIELHLGQHDATQRVDVAPWPINTRHDYLLQIHVLQFEGYIDAPVVDGEEFLKTIQGQEVRVHLVANWQIVDPGTNDVLHQDQTDVMLGGWDTNVYSNVVTGLDQTLEEMAERIAVVLGGM